ncbi:hypothetical protein RF11_06045 [Thelohanellus kitauei]|uniref:Uncharacterized protein n=1 Tax=Thelohanellus kitauei TaxID=669202 RepID=A0A0C2MF48_THEKT|nr:hypothetical protein RF11_06045 [Thelohanellus kitauei]
MSTEATGADESSSSSTEERPLVEARCSPRYPASGHSNGSILSRLTLLYLGRYPCLVQDPTSLTAPSPAIGAGQPGPGNHRSRRKLAKKMYCCSSHAVLRRYRPKIQRNDLHRPPQLAKENKWPNNRQTISNGSILSRLKTPRSRVNKKPADMSLPWQPRPGCGRATGGKRDEAGPPSKLQAHQKPGPGLCSVWICAKFVASGAESAELSGAKGSTCSSVLKSQS